MKLSIERSVLLKALGHVQSVVERRNTIPILSNVRLDASGDTLALNATDMDLDIIEQVSATVARPGSTTAPAHTLYEIVRKLPDGSQVELELEPGDVILVLRAGRSRFSLACLPVEDFPVLSQGEMPCRFDLPAQALRDLIDRTRFAISTEETRYYLNGIYMHATTVDGIGVLRAVATDGHRLARVEVPLPDGAAAMPGVIVPRKTVLELRKLLEETPGTVGIALSDAKICFDLGCVVLTSKLIDGTFPDYERVIPINNDKTLLVTTRDFASAVDRVSVIAAEKSRAIKVAVNRGEVDLSASSAEYGSASEVMEAHYESSPLEIGFNARYLMEIISQIGSDETMFLFADSASPTILREATDGSAIYVLMPMRV